MFYFKPFPTIEYRMPNETRTVSATNIMKRFTVANMLRNSTVTYDEYYIEDGERADVIAYQYYGDQTLDWLIFLCNEIHDPYFEWPLSYEQFNSYIRQKYGSVSTAQTTNHHYEQILSVNEVIDDYGVKRIRPNKSVTVDYTTYTTLVASERKAVSVFDHEFELNEKRKHIYLLDLNYKLVIKEQHPYIFNEGVYLR